MNHSFPAQALALAFAWVYAVADPHVRAPTKRFALAMHGALVVVLLLVLVLFNEQFLDARGAGWSAADVGVGMILVAAVYGPAYLLYRGASRGDGRVVLVGRASFAATSAVPFEGRPSAAAVELPPVAPAAASPPTSPTPLLQTVMGVEIADTEKPVEPDLTYDDDEPTADSTERLRRGSALHDHTLLVDDRGFEGGEFPLAAATEVEETKYC